ncbi:MAG TPA: peptidoglycan DD-metalloendopeptidase family protein [Spirochaetota bacterium]|nr:peptidoglycan DD-metalloendopeptidase family protein [Spirochaetota bacterium]
MRMIQFPVFLVMVLLPICMFGEDRAAYYRIIEQTYKNKDYTTGIAAMKRAVKEHPDEPNFVSNLMFMYCHAKRFDEARQAGERALPKFPGHQYTRDAYRWALTGLGWELFQKKDFTASGDVFKKAYTIFPEDKDVINGYGSALREQKHYEKAVTVFEKGMALHPDHSYIRQNLSWTYLAIADGLMSNEKNTEAVPYMKKFLALGDANDPNVIANYLYRCSRLRLFDEGKKKLAAALSRFPLTDDIFKSGYWLYFHSAENNRTAGNYEGAVTELKALCAFSAKKNMPYEHGMSYHHFAVSAAHTSIYSMIESICPYWRKFGPGEKARAEKLLGTLEKNMPREMEFIARNLKGHILYREDRVAESHRELERAYQSAMKLPFATVYRYGERVDISLPLKGTYNAGNCLSTQYITHMGLNRHCYDFSGADGKGNGLRRNVDYKKSRLNDWYGYGDTIYSPVGGTIMAAEGGNRDDPPYPKALGRGNYVWVLSDDGKIYNFYHLMQGSLAVKKGDRVTEGQKLARLGNSSSTSPHLHFGVYSRDWIVTYPVYFKNYIRIKDGVRVPSGIPGKGSTQELIRGE